MNLLGKGYICFTSLDSEYLPDYYLLEKMKDKFDIIDIFELENAKDKFVYDVLNEKGNFIYLVDSDDEALDSVIDEIYYTYKWDISIEAGKISLDKYKYSSNDWMVALIFSGNSVWNENNWLNLFIVPEDVKVVFADFLNKYSGFIDSLSIEGPFIIILFFNKDSNGEYLKIKVDEYNSDLPHENSFRIFRKEKTDNEKLE